MAQAIGFREAIQLADKFFPERSGNSDGSDLLPSRLQQTMDRRFERGTRGSPQYCRRTERSQCQSDNRKLTPSKQSPQLVQQNRVVTHFPTEQNEAWIENEGQV
jgi:hypothetical protein